MQVWAISDGDAMVTHRFSPLSLHRPPWLRATLIPLYLLGGEEKEALSHRLRQRREAKGAISAVPASMLTAICHMLRDGTSITTAAHRRLQLRWSPWFGQFGGLAKLGSGYRQAANFSVPVAQYASSGVRPASAECGRRVL